MYPGSFDPVTEGHIDIINRASNVVDELIVGVFINTTKNPMFSTEERVNLIKKATKDMPNIKVDSFSGLLVDYMHKKDANLIIRGLRAVSDFEYEFQISLANRKLDKNIETIFFMTDSQYSYLSSSIVKEIARFGGNIDGLIPDIIKKDITQKLDIN